MIVRKLLTAAALVTTLAGIGTADAQTWAQRHPRRTEVNARLALQNARINQGLRDHQLTRAEAHQLRSDDRSIRTEERADASLNGSHITRGEQRQINAQENANSRAIHHDRVIGS